MRTRKHIAQEKNVYTIRQTILSALCVLCGSVLCFAQAGRAELNGQIRDSTGANIRAANITLTEVATNLSQTVIADQDGLFVLTNLKPSLYKLTVEAIGFQRLVRERIQLATGERIHLDLTLTVGKVTEIITITEPIPLLRTEHASLGQVIDNRKIVSLPLNGRNFLSLVALAPSVAAPPRTSEGPSFPRINGGRSAHCAIGGEGEFLRRTRSVLECCGLAQLLCSPILKRRRDRRTPKRFALFPPATKV